MTATIAAEMGETVHGSNHYYSLFAIGIILFVLTFIINITADMFLHRNKKMRTTTKQKIAFSILFLCTIIVVLPVLFVLGVITKNGIKGISWNFLTTMPFDGMRQGGIYPAIVGTLYLVSLSIVFSLPVGVMAAIYLNEYAKDNLLTRLIRLAIVNLAGVSSVVYGLFGLALFVTFMKFGVSILSGALTLAIMNLPVIITASREALASVPYSFREVSLSLGLSRWQTIRHSVLPFAIPGSSPGQS